MELGENQAHVEPPPINLIKETCNGKLDKDFIKLKHCRDPTSITLDLYEFNISLFVYGDTEEFLLFIHDFKMYISAT